MSEDETIDRTRADGAEGRRKRPVPEGTVYPGSNRPPSEVTASVGRNRPPPEAPDFPGRNLTLPENPAAHGREVVSTAGRPEDICTQYGISCAEEADALKESLLEVAGLSELFKALADESRTKILHLLSQRELCVCDLAFLLETNLPAVSHHLRLLRMLRLVSSRKEGKQVFYRLDDHHVLTLIRQAQEHYIDRT